jgi:hypothetical protein
MKGSVLVWHEYPSPSGAIFAQTSPFQGNGVKLFRLVLDRMNKDCSQKLYANFVSIIQSSGMGKSRLVDETAKLIFTIPFCLRSELVGGCTPVVIFSILIYHGRLPKGRYSPAAIFSDLCL